MDNSTCLNITRQEGTKELLISLINSGSYIMLVIILTLIVVIKFMNRRQLKLQTQKNEVI